MPFVILPSRNKVVQAAFAGLRADERKAKKAKPVEEPVPAPAAKKVSNPRAKRAGAKR